MRTLAHCDFLICAARGYRASYAHTLTQLRRFLVQRAGVPQEDVFQFALHSLKVTGLSWALQLNVDQLARKAWGHHRSREAGDKMAAKYGRDDDVLPGLRAQLRVLQAVRSGWVLLLLRVAAGAPPERNGHCRCCSRRHSAAGRTCSFCGKKCRRRHRE